MLDTVVLTVIDHEANLFNIVMLDITNNRDENVCYQSDVPLRKSVPTMTAKGEGFMV